MKISTLRLIMAAIALLFVAAACAGDDGPQWTFAPVASTETVASSAAPGASASTEQNGDVADATPAASGEAAPAATSGPTGTPAGTPDEPRLIELQLTGALQITDAAGTRVQDIPVTPGETIKFQVTNLAGFEHNFYIGTEAELTAPSASTETGIQQWTNGTMELTWTVPDDVEGLQFACTVAGHYTLMHGSFSVAGGTVEPPASAEPVDPAATMAPMASMAASGSMSPDATVAPDTDNTGTTEPRVIDLQLDGALQITDAAGTKVQDIAVTPGETVIFRLNNTAGYAHNFYIGTDAELSAPAATTGVGIPDWSTGVQELTWTVPEDIEGLKFGCTVPGHYALMQGTFSAGDGTVEPSAPVQPSEPAASMAPMASMAASESMSPDASLAPDTGSAGTADKRVINLEATAALQFTQNGEQVRDIPVTPGETVVIRVDNTAGFSHNFYIGTDAQLSAPAATTDVGIPDWISGVQFVEWQVPSDVTDLKFGCTVPGHYTLMQGTISVSP